MTSAPQAGPEGTPALGEAAATGTGGAPAARAVPEATVARLAVYLRMLGELAEQGTDTVSSDELAAVCGVNSAKLRKDLSYVGSHGIRGVGYEVGPLLHHRIVDGDERRGRGRHESGEQGHDQPEHDGGCTPDTGEPCH